ncbi:MAG: helix-turn-helix transcriptional regulator [Cyanophyceae cyanobacterium]
MIPLQEGMSLIIMDYSVHSTFLYKTSRSRTPFLEFEFCLDGPAAGQGAFVPHVALKESFGVRAARPRQLKVEVIFSHALFEAYSHAVIQHLHPQDQAMLFNWASWVHRFQRGYEAQSSQSAFAQILSGGIASTLIPRAVDPFNHLEFYSFGRLWISLTSEMNQLVNQILSCPNSGQIRRTYLAGKAFQLVNLLLRGLNHSNAISYPLVDEDLGCIYQAGRILARNLNNPPSVEALARQVGLNRFKLNQGFHQVYGTTPFRYLRHCRLNLAEHLLTTSELAIEAVAHQVGYTSRSNFASAFRQWRGLNPKALQLYSRDMDQSQGFAS